MLVPVLIFGLTQHYVGPQDQAAQVGGIASGIRPRPFLFWLFSQGTPFNLSLTEQNKFAPVTAGHYSASETEPASAGYGIQWMNYRNTVTQANIVVGNPVPLLGMRISAVTASNPVNASLYPWTRQDQVYCNNSNAPDRSPEAYEVYLGSIRPDTHSFHRQVDPAVVSPNSFQPRYLTEAPDSWWAPYGAGDSALWPFDFFRSRGWINNATPLYCRPTIKISSPEVRSFVANTVNRLLNAYTGANTASFDNASMYHNEQYNSHPGFGVVGSPYQTVSPNQDFANYLESVQTTLNQNGKKLLVNAGLDAYQLFADHIDAIYTEDDAIHRGLTPAEIAEHLTAYKYLIDRGVRVFVQYRGQEAVNSPGVTGEVSNFGTNRQDTEFFLAASMLVYQDGKYGFSPNFNVSQGVPFSEEFYLPTAAGDPTGPYQQNAAIPNFYYRKFANATVILNANDHDLYLSDPQLVSMGLAGRNFPHRLTAKQGLITVHNCSTLNSLDSLFAITCGQYYTTHPEPPAPVAGDANCNRDVGAADLVNDRNAFYLAATNPAAYATQYAYCGDMTSALNVDGSGGVTINDYNQWFRTRLIPPRRGDANCDGVMLSEPPPSPDRPAFMLAFDTSAAQYQAAYPQCGGHRVYLNDISGDGVVDEEDLPLFEDTVAHGGVPPVSGAKGDTNCDWHVDNFDIDPFVFGIVDPEHFLSRYHDCPSMATLDMNCNGRPDNFDISLFVTRLVEGQTAYEAERARQGYSCPAA